MRIAFADLLFSWPPHGGADVDLYHTALGLQALGHEVRLFGAAYSKSWERGKFKPDELPFPSERLDFTLATFNRRTMPARFREAVDKWQPDVVVLADGFFLKPYVADALGHYPTVGRYYAYELACPRDLLLFKNGAPCPHNYLQTPQVCRQCALAHLQPQIKSWGLLAWTHEFLAARAFMPGYHRRLTESLRRLDAVIVSNMRMKSQLEDVCSSIHIFPGGVDANAFPYHPLEMKSADQRKVVFMAGRAEDPAKGLETLLAAGKLLAESRNDFEIWATHTNRQLTNGWFKAIGWQDRAAMAERYRQADICVVPSIWEEPFGLTAVEAMAAGRPVCASRVGGLQGIVRDGETGFLLEPKDSATLAKRLGHLLDEGALRQRMGEAGRRVVEEEYDWQRLVARHWPALLEALVS